MTDGHGQQWGNGLWEQGVGWDGQKKAKEEKLRQL